MLVMSPSQTLPHTHFPYRQRFPAHTGVHPAGPKGRCTLAKDLERRQSGEVKVRAYLR